MAMLSVSSKCTFDTGTSRSSFAFDPSSLDLDPAQTHPAAHTTNGPFQFGVPSKEERVPLHERSFVIHPASPSYSGNHHDDTRETESFKNIDYIRKPYSFGADLHTPALPKEWDNALSTLLRDDVAICAPFDGDFSPESALHAPIPKGCNSPKATIARCWKDLQKGLSQYINDCETQLLDNACTEHIGTLETLTPEHDDDRRLCEWLRHFITCVQYDGEDVRLELLTLKSTMLLMLKSTLCESEKDTFMRLHNNYFDRLKGMYTAVASMTNIHIANDARWSAICELGQDGSILYSILDNTSVCSIERQICKTVYECLSHTHTYAPYENQRSRLFPYIPSRWVSTLVQASLLGRCHISEDTWPSIRAFYSLLDKLGATTHVKTDVMKWSPTAEAYQLLMNPLTQEAVEVISSAYYHQFLMSVDPSRLVGTQLLALDSKQHSPKPRRVTILSIGNDAPTEDKVSYVPTFEVQIGEGNNRTTFRKNQFPVAPPIVGVQDGQSYLAPALALAKTLQARATYIKRLLEHIGQVVKQYNEGTSFRQCFHLWECSQTYAQLSDVNGVCTEAFIAEVERLACTAKAASLDAPCYNKFNELRVLLTRLGEQDTMDISLPLPLDNPSSVLEGRPRELGIPDPETLLRVIEQRETYQMFDNEMDTHMNHLRQIESERQSVRDALMSEFNAWATFLKVHAWTIAEMTPRDNSAAWGAELSLGVIDYLRKQVARVTKEGADEWSLALRKVQRFRDIWGDKRPPEKLLKIKIETIAHNKNADLSYPPAGLKVSDVLSEVTLARLAFWEGNWKGVLMCAICYENGPFTSEFCSSTETCCSEAAKICRSCTIDCLRHKLGSNGVTADGISCLAAHCQARVPNAAIRAYLSEDQQRLYGQLRRAAVVDANPDMSWCRTPGCQTNGMDSFMDTSVTLRCGTCNALHCKSCLECSHPNESCEAYKRRVTDECLLTDHQTCPRCNVRIHRIDGCPHMQCTRCPNQTHFCYHCGREYYTRDEDAANDAPDPEGKTSRCDSGGCFYEGVDYEDEYEEE